MASFSFQRIAPFYDILARLIFGNTIDKAQIHFFSIIPKQSSILIIGGGSGRILPELITKAQPQNITFIEASAKMLQMAQKKVSNIDKYTKHKVHFNFVHGTENDIPATERYDVLMTFFLFDLYATAEAKKMAKKLSDHLKPSGLWLFSDFHLDAKKHGYQLHKHLLKLMYAFFRVVSNLQNKSLPEYQSIFNELQFYPVQQKYFYQNFIVSITYRKLIA